MSKKKEFMQSMLKTYAKEVNVKEKTIYQLTALEMWLLTQLYNEVYHTNQDGFGIPKPKYISSMMTDNEVHNFIME